MSLAIEDEIKCEPWEFSEENFKTEIPRNDHYKIRNEAQPISKRKVENDKVKGQPKKKPLRSSLKKQEDRSEPSMQETSPPHLQDEIISFKCGYCQKTFAAQHFLKRHEKLYKNTKKDCDICGEKFCLEEQLRRHKNELHPKNSEEESSFFICSICYEVSTNRFALEAHVLKAHKVEKFHQCSFCTLKFKRKRDLRLHLPIHKSQNLLECPHCQGNFISLSSLNMHRKVSHPNEFIEDEDNDITSSNDASNNNETTNDALIRMEQEDPLTTEGNKAGCSPVFKCKFCDKEFKKLLDLEEHAARHTGVPLYTCAFCSMVFNSHANVYRHHKLLHPKESQAAVLRGEKVEPIKLPKGNLDCVCKECGMRTEDFGALVAHAKEVHQTECVYSCKVCPKTFTKKHNLINHMATHDNEEAMHDCSHCLFKSETPKQLNDHLQQTHPDEYFMSFAHSIKKKNKSQNTSSAITSVNDNKRSLEEPRNSENNFEIVFHKKKSDKPTMYECNVCERVFQQQRAYKEHMSFHEGVPLYECPYCPKEFYFTQTFLVHRQRVHPKELEMERRERQNINKKPSTGKTQKVDEKIATKN